jgi:hypothetical protein
MVKFVEHFFWSMVWIFLLLIVGYFILGFIRTKADGNIFGSIANWVDVHSQPQ